MKFTTVVGVDAKTIKQLTWSHQTWKKFAPEIWQNPMLVFYSETLQPGEISGMLEHPALTMVNWPPANSLYDSQREQMLSGFVHMPRFVKTEWWMKLDTDAVRKPESKQPWIEPEWFDYLDPFGRPYAFIGNRWPYTKPADQMAWLDKWGDHVDGLNSYPPLDLPYNPNARTCRHKGGRLASWITFFNTEWSLLAASFCKFGHIPVPSEDGYHFYVAKRRRDAYLLTKFKKRGWTNVSRLNKLITLCQEILK